MEQTKGYVHSLESFGSADGPGVRYIIFLSGCAMRCQFCHNPDTWDMQKGTLYTAKELIDKAWRYRNYWGKDGGITISGGEPLLQIDFLTEIFTLAKEKGMLDIKHIDEKVHQTLTGQTGENIKEMAREMSDMGQPMWIRHVLIPGDNSQDKYLIEMREFIQTLKTVERVEILPYHTLGVFKWEQLGIDYPLKGVNPPTQEEVKHAEELLGI